MKDKKVSRRTTLKRRYNIEKKVREHQRRVRKLARQTTKRFKRRDPGIPNSWPFKAQMLAGIQRDREERAREKKAAIERQREERKAAMLKQVEESNDAAEYSNLRERADAAAAQFIFGESADQQRLVPGTCTTTTTTISENSTAVFVRSVRSVIEQSDVVVEVLDVRDPQSYRSLSLERQIIADGKKLVLLLNKIDLVPRSATEAWLTHLRRSHPTVAFKCAFSKGTRPINHCHVPATALSEGELRVGNRVVGATDLIQLVKNYARCDGAAAKASVTVGIIGCPNVGKSSVINSLCRNANAAKAGGEAGVTRATQEVKLDSHVKLIDSPGVMLEMNESNPTAILCNSVKLSTVKDPVEVVNSITSVYPAERLMRLFKVPLFFSTSEFLGHIARLHGKLGKGGAIDYTAAAMFVLSKWTSGGVQHFCLPPQVDPVDKDAIDAGLITGPRFVAALGEELKF